MAEAPSQRIVYDLRYGRVDAGDHEARRSEDELAPEETPDVVGDAGRHGVPEGRRKRFDARRDPAVELADVDRRLVAELDQAGLQKVRPEMHEGPHGAFFADAFGDQGFVQTVL